MLRAGSSDGIDALDEEQNQNLLYRCVSLKPYFLLEVLLNKWVCRISALMPTDPPELRRSLRDLMLNR